MRKILILLIILAIPIVAVLLWMGRTVEPLEREGAEDVSATFGAADSAAPVLVLPSAEPFSLDRAYEVAGSHVPTSVNEFYLFHVDAEQSLEENVAGLLALMQSAQKDSDYLAVIGADGMLTFDVFSQALDQLGDGPLSEVTVIYLGLEEHQAPLKQRVEGKQAEFRFSAYPAKNSV